MLPVLSSPEGELFLVHVLVFANYSERGVLMKPYSIAESSGGSEIKAKGAIWEHVVNFLREIIFTLKISTFAMVSTIQSYLPGC